MSDTEISAEWIDGRLRRPAASITHLVTALDASFLHAIVQINGAKLGVWNHPAPYDADDRYEPFRENVPLSAWALPYNQRELLASPDFGGFQAPMMIVDTTADEAVLAKAGEAWPDDPEKEFTALPDLLAKIGWALIPVAADNSRALFAASKARSDYAGLLQHWCHEHGRTFYTIVIQDEKPIVRIYPAPDENRKHAVFQEGSQFLGRMALLGIPGEEASNHLSELLAELNARNE